MRCTKIIATVGPASRSPDVLRQLLTAGVDVFRLNFSHGTHESHAETYRAIRTSCGGLRPAYRRHAGLERTQNPDGSAGRE